MIKHSAAIQVANDVTLRQRQSWNAMLANAYDDLPHQDLFEMRLTDLCETLDYDSNNISHLKELLRGLRYKEVEWNLLGADQEEEWGVMGLLAEVWIVNGKVVYGYAPTLRQRLYDPEVYAKINLSLTAQFASKHALVIYENCLPYYSFEKKRGCTEWFDIPTYRKLLGIKDEEYPEFKYLSKRTIKEPLEEINREADIWIKHEYHRESGKVTKVRFWMGENKKFALKPLNAKKESSQQSFKLDPPEIDNQELFQTLTAKFKIDRKTAIKILKTTDEFQIQEALEYVRSQDGQGKIKTLPGFTVKAIQEGWKLDTSAQVDTPDQEQIAQLKVEYAQSVISSADKEGSQSLQETFKQAKIQPSKYLSERYEANGFDDATIQEAFRAYIIETKIPEAEADFLAFAKKQGYALEKAEDGYQLAA